MMSGRLTSTACSVEIVTPEGVRLLFDTTQASADLLHVQTQYDMGEAAGSFSLTFAPRRVDGRTYDQLIPLRSLVTIRMEAPAGDVTDEESIVMLGLTEDHGVQEDYSRGQPQRVVTITGRSMALVFLDMQLHYFPGLAERPEGTLTFGDHRYNLYIPSNLIEPFKDPAEALRTVLAYFTGLPNRVPLPPRRQHVEVQKATEHAQARQPDRPKPQVRSEQVEKAQARPANVRPGRRPAPGEGRVDLTAYQENQARITAMLKANPGLSRREAALALADQLTQGTVESPPPAPVAPAVMRSLATSPQLTGPPVQPMTREGVVRRHNVLLNLQLPGRSLADVLDMNDDEWSLFDEGLQVRVGENTPYALTLWHFLGQFVDGYFQEFFTRVERGKVTIHFRAKPFLHDPLKAGSRFRSDVRTLQSFTYTQEEWEAIYVSSHLRRQAQNVYNTFLVIPRLASTSRSAPGFEWKFFPIFLNNPEDPSYLLKYGIRLLRDDTPYLTTKVTGQSDPTNHQHEMQVRRAHLWSKILAAWYGLGSEMYQGVITVLGSPRWNIGHRLQIRDERGEREFYIEGVAHSYDFRTGRYLTQLRVTRGWYLSGLVDEREQVPQWKLHMEMVTPNG